MFCVYKDNTNRTALQTKNMPRTFIKISGPLVIKISSVFWLFKTTITVFVYQTNHPGFVHYFINSEIFGTGTSATPSRLRREEIFVLLILILITNLFCTFLLLEGGVGFCEVRAKSRGGEKHLVL
jgi:hypothetical protein